MQGNHPLAPIARINHAGALCGTQALLGGQAAAGENGSKEAGGDFCGNSGGDHYSLAGSNLNALRFLHLDATVPFMERHIRNMGPKVEAGVADMGASRHLDGMYHNADRRRTIGKITAAMPGMDGDMWTLAQQTLSKLKHMTDSDYDSQKFYFTDENE